MHFSPTSLPSKSQTEEFFSRLRTIILNIIEIVLLVLAMISVVRNHAPAHDPVTPPAVHVAPFSSEGKGRCSASDENGNIKPSGRQP